MKIGIISVINEPWGGSEELWAAMAEQALAKGHSIVYCTLDFPSPAAKVKSLLAKGLVLKPRRAYVPAQESSLKRQFKKGMNMVMDAVINPFNDFFDDQPDIVLYNGTALSLAEHFQLLEKWNAFNGKKVILAHFIAEHNVVIAAADRKKISHFFGTANHAFFISNRSRVVTERTLAAALKNWTVVRNPVNMRDSRAINFPAVDGVVQFAMVGNLLAVHKGQDAMLAVLGNADWRNEAWHLNIYGQGMDREYLQDLAAFYHIQHKVTFHGRVDDIRQLWSQNHLLLMPSVMEGMPLAVVEAMLCGRPVLATDVGGHTEWIEDNVQGFIAAASSEKALDEALHRAWKRKDEWEFIGNAAHEKANQLYDSHAGSTLLKLLEQIVEKG